MRTAEQRTKHADYMREWRARIKEEKSKDEIEKNLERQSERKKAPKQALIEDNYDKMMNAGRDILESDLDGKLGPQFTQEKETLMGGNIFGTESNPNKPKPKSYQQILSELDPKHSE